MIKRFESTDTNLNHNKYVLHPMKTEVVEEANSIFEVEIDLPKKTVINKRDIITAPTPRGVQPFRVYRIVKTLYGVRAYARHLFYDLANALLIDTRPTNTNVNSALQAIFDSIGWTGWSYLSDITELKTAYYIRKNPVEAIIGAENSVLNVWGGNLVRDNKEVRIYADGIDRGYEIRLGKNLIGIEDDSDDSNVVTRLYPTYEMDQVIYGIPELYVDSPLISNYPTPITKEIRVALTDDQKGYTDEQIYQVLRDYCNNLYAVDSVDKPVVNYKIDFVELSKIARLEQEVSYNYAGLEQLTYETIETLTYEQLESVTTIQQFLDLLEKVDLYDKVKIRVKELDIDLQAKVIKYRYDALAEKYIKIELGGFKNSNQYQVNNIVQQMRNDRENASSEFKELYDLAINKVTGNKGGYQITRLNANNEPYETLWMDTPDIETAVNVLRINQNGIAGSNTGFNGPYNVAITTDGYVIAERILANQLSAISANLGEVTTGKLRSTDGTLEIDLNNKTFKIGSGSESVHTDLQYNGLQVKDGEDLIAAFGESGAIIPKIETNVLNMVDNVGGTYTVGPGQMFSTISSALYHIFPRNTKIYMNDQDIYIEVFGIINENVEIYGLQGHGRVIIRFNIGSRLQGKIDIKGCPMSIYVIGVGGPNTGVITNTTDDNMFKVKNSAYVQISNLILDNDDVGYLSDISQGSHVHFQAVDVINTVYIARINNMSRVGIIDSKGNVGALAHADEGSTLMISGTIPECSEPNIWNNQGAFLMQNGIVIETPSAYSPPPITSQVFTQVFTAAQFDTLVHGTSSIDSSYGPSAAQNRWDSLMGWKDGRIRTGAEIFNFFDGGTAISIRMRLRRINTSHGSSGAVYPAPYNHSASYPSGAIRGGWTGWATVPSSLFTAGGATLTFYNGVQGSAGYTIWDAIEIEVTVTKNV